MNPKYFIEIEWSDAAPSELCLGGFIEMKCDEDCLRCADVFELDANKRFKRIKLWARPQGVPFNEDFYAKR